MSIEDMETSKQRPDLHKYIKIVDWDVPDVDEAKARRLVLAEIKRAVNRPEIQ